MSHTIRFQHGCGTKTSIKQNNKNVLISDDNFSGIVAAQRADPEAEIDENQRHSGKSDRQLLVGLSDVPRD